MKLKRVHRKWFLRACATFILIAIALVTLNMVGYQFFSGKKDVSTQNKIVSVSKSPKIAYGFAVGSSTTGLKSNDRVIQLKAIRDTGATEVRFDLDWSSIQPQNAKTYSWAQYDSLIKDIKAAGLNSIITLNRTPAWARAKNCRTFECPPADPSTFAQFAATAVERYRDYNVRAWEVWNEPNIENFWKPLPNADQYAALLKETYTAIKKRNSNAVVLVGGLEGKANNGNSMYIDGRTFLTQLYGDGTKDYFDGVAYHPYTSLRLPDTPSSRNGWLKMAQTTPSIRSIMAANDDQQKNVWITEFGVPTSGPGSDVTDLKNVTQLTVSDHVSLQVQSQITAAVMNDVKSSTWISSFDWYTYINSTDPSDYGLLSENGNAKPALTVFEQAIK